VVGGGGFAGDGDALNTRKPELGKSTGFTASTLVPDPIAFRRYFDRNSLRIYAISKYVTDEFFKRYQTNFVW